MSLFKSFNAWLVIIGILSLFFNTEIGAIVTLFLIATGIGAPLAFLSYYLLTIFAVLLLGRIAYALLPTRIIPSHLARVFMSGLIACALFSTYPVIENNRLQIEAATMMSDDVNDVDESMRRPWIDTLALVETHRQALRGEKTNVVACGEVCLRILLTKSADNVMIVASDQIGLIPKDHASGYTYHMGQGTSCSDAVVPDFSDRTGVGGDLVKLKDLWNFKKTENRCLLRRPTNLQAADGLFMWQQTETNGNGYIGGKLIAPAKMKARRMTAYIREDGVLQKKFQVTAGNYRAPIPFIPLLRGASRGAPIQFSKRTQSFGKLTENSNSISFPELMLNKFDLDIGLRGMEVITPVRTPARASFKKPGYLSKADLVLVLRYLRVLGGQKSLLREDLEFALAILRDRRIPVFSEFTPIVARSIASGRDTAEQFAEILFKRVLESAETDVAKSWPDVHKNSARQAAAAIAYLPATAIRTHGHTLIELANDPARQLTALKALERLPDLGADAVPSLLHLVDSAFDEERNSRTKLFQRRNLYRIGLKGLCRIGAQQAAASRLFNLMDRTAFAPVHFGTDLLRDLLSNLGISADEAWSHLKSDPDYESLGRDMFGVHYKRAKNKFVCNEDPASNN